MMSYETDWLYNKTVMAFSAGAHNVILTRKLSVDLSTASFSIYFF